MICPICQGTVIEEETMKGYRRYKCWKCDGKKEIEDGTTAITGKKIVAIQFLSDTTFTTLTPNSSAFIGTSGGNGDAIDTNNTFPTGLTLFGQFTGFTLATGSVIAYEI